MPGAHIVRAPRAPQPLGDMADRRSTERRKDKRGSRTDVKEVSYKRGDGTESTELMCGECRQRKLVRTRTGARRRSLFGRRRR